MKRDLFVWLVATALIFGLCGLELAFGQQPDNIEVKLISGDAILTYSEKDQDIITIQTLVPMLKDVTKAVQFNDPKIESYLTAEGLEFYRKLMQLSVPYRGRNFVAIKGIGYPDGWTAIIRKRGFDIFKWDELVKGIELALTESGFALKGPSNPGK